MALIRGPEGQLTPRKQKWKI